MKHSAMLLCVPCLFAGSYSTSYAAVQDTGNGVEFQMRTPAEVKGKHTGLGVSFYSGIQSDGTLLATITMNNKKFLMQLEGAYWGAKFLKLDIVPLTKDIPKMRTKKDDETLIALYGPLKDELDETVFIEYSLLKFMAALRDFILIDEYFPAGGIERGSEYKNDTTMTKTDGSGCWTS
ncbi:MAG: hypothetical protein HY880_00600, partial [Deltaproteobacteria bacterium]|nr:hypothetical protein [Deltaproteobacteria bacterium]